MAVKEGKGLTRRSFLKSTALTAGAMAAAGMAGCSSVDTEGGAGDAPVQVEELSYNGACRGNCGGYCSLDVKVREGKIVSTTPRRFPREYEGVAQGCVKGTANIARIYGTHRLTHPLLRVGERGSGEWEQISWDEAFALIAEKFQAAIESDGAKSIALWTGSGNGSAYLNAPNAAGVGVSRFLQKSGATTLVVGGDWAGMYMLFNVLGTPKHPVEDFQNAKTIVFWGSNPAAASLSRNAWYWICKAKDNGAHFITIDPLYSETAAKSDMWLPIRVGSDGALMLAMANYIIENGLQSDEYLKNGSVAPLLVKEGGAYLRTSDLGLAEAGAEDDVPVVWDEDAQDFVAHNAATNPVLGGVSEANGIAVATVYDLTLESIKPFTVEYAAEECGLPAEQIVELTKACLEGGPTFFSIDWGLEHTYNAFHLYYNAAFLASLIGQIGMPGAGYSCPNMPKSRIFRAPVTMDKSALVVEGAQPNMSFMGDYMVEIMETGKWAGEDMTINCLYMQAHNPLDNACAPLEMIKAWDKIGFVVTAEQFMTTSAHYSDLVLPAVMAVEMEDFVSAYTGDVYMAQKAIEPAGEAKPDIDIWRGIADAMGWTDLYPMTNEEYLRAMLDTPENIEAGVGYDDYHEQGAIVGDYVAGEGQAAEYNALGRTQFYVEQYIPRINYGQTFEAHDRLPWYKPPIEAYLDNPDREKYPLFGFSNHDVYHGQSMHAHNVWLDQFRTCDGKPYCRIHEKAAAERGIKTGDLVRCWNDHGHVVLKAVVTKGIREDSVWFPHGFFWDEFVDGFAQSLTGYYLDPQTSNANFNDFILQVEKYEGGAE